jgi:hypothetical protein
VVEGRRAPSVGRRGVEKREEKDRDEAIVEGVLWGI